MLEQHVVEMTVALVHVRLARTGAGFLVTRLARNPVGDPIQLRRWRFPPHEARESGTKLLDEVLTAGETESCTLRAAAEQATRRAIVAGQRMRSTAGARRMLEAAAAGAMNTYLNRSQRIAQQCAEAQAQLTVAGFPITERNLPAWIAEVQRILGSAADASPTTL